MGRIFYLMGKSASGKDTLYEILKKDPELNLSTVVLYTTRPMRDGEQDGVTYHFVTEEFFQNVQRQHPEKLIEARTYQTMHGPWTYFTMDDGRWDTEHRSYIMVGVLESYHRMKEHFGADQVIPLYIEVEDGERLQRALQREKSQEVPRYEEMCRRFLADQQDFSQENLAAEGIENVYRNENLQECVGMLRGVILKMAGSCN